jgi:hypothetical protein
MDYFAGLDVSVKETSVCIVDDTGKIVRETRVASEPEALLQVLTNTIYRFKRVGLEAGRDRACTLKDPLPRSFIDLSLSAPARFHVAKTKANLCRASKSMSRALANHWGRRAPRRSNARPDH